MTALNVKNIPALLRPDAYTVQVKFPRDADPRQYGDQTYAYATIIPGIKVDDHVLVTVSNTVKCVKVVAVDDGVVFDALDAKELKWVIDKVNVEAYTNLQCENQQIIKTYTDALARRKQTAASEALRAALDPEAQAQIDAVLGLQPTKQRRPRKAPASRRSK